MEAVEALAAGLSMLMNGQDSLQDGDQLGLCLVNVTISGLNVVALVDTDAAHKLIVRLRVVIPRLKW